ncbi:hypothetical protein [Synechococcus sp. Cu2B8-bc1011]|uniref:hypothetical protein n=1 Tax=Synechococcus sp. Cu2B8-bc1011 TaxID=3093725 RepID=UPI0039AF454B
MKKTTSKKVLNKAIFCVFLIATTGCGGFNYSDKNQPTVVEKKSQPKITQEYFLETPKGLKPSNPDHGSTINDLKFLQAFRKHLVSPEEYNYLNIKKLIHDELIAGHKDSANSLAAYGLSGRESLIAYTVLRVNGSIPVYEIRRNIPPDFKELITGTSGNCSDHSLRLMLALETIGVKSALISNVTKNIGGHVFVDAYDPIDNKFYILDPTFNLIIIGDSNTQKSLVAEIIDTGDNTKKKILAQNLRIIAFPTIVRFVDPGYTAFRSNTLTPDFINETRSKRDRMWRKWALEDGKELRSWWERTPGHRPQSAGGFAHSNGIKLPNNFDSSDEYALTLMRSSGFN